MNIYKEILKQNLPRLFNLYDMDPVSSTYGFGDRLFWGWKIKDFANATMQGGVHSLAIALKLGLMENKDFALNVIDSAIRAIEKIRSKNGSMAESYPNEHSFCVTALVAFDVLSAIDYIKEPAGEKKERDYLNIVEPLIRFISRHGETHAVISNHLATGAAAIAMWNVATGEKLERGAELLEIIYRHQSPEGWYLEYEGADPGYQTLSTNYLFRIFQITGDPVLLKSIEKSADFLKYFIHPDGTIGGLYGSRNTEVYYPGGVVGFSRKANDFPVMELYLRGGIAKGRHIPPQAIDSGNFIPLLNSYATAALEYEKLKAGPGQDIKLPFQETDLNRKFNDVGIYIHGTQKYYAIISFKKGGAFKVYDKKEKKLDIEDGGLFGRLKNGKRFSTQQFDNTAQFQDKEIKAGFYKINDSLPSPIMMIVLRIFSLTIFRSIFLGDLFKKLIVKKLMTGKSRIDGFATRKFKFNSDKLIIKEDITPPANAEEIGHVGKSKAIHMASSGYYLQPMENLVNSSDIVVFQTI